MPDHRFALSAEVHEPKHITNTTTADAGKVITPSSSVAGTSELRFLSSSDLSDSVDIVTNSELLENDAINFQGWQMIEDGLISTPTIVFEATPKLLTVDHEDEENNTNDSYLPRIIRGTGSLWDIATSKITPIEVGDSYVLRVNLRITDVSGNPNNITLKLDIGSSPTPSIITLERIHNITKTPPYSVSFSLPIFTLDTFKANGGRIFIQTDTGSVTVGARSLFISRTGSGNNL